MDHSEAEQSHAAERYILHEMAGTERDGFEEHYFDCRLCAEDVADGAKLVAAGRRVSLDSPAVVPMTRRWTAWIPAAAAAVLVIIAGTIGLPHRSGPSVELIHHTVGIDAGTSRASAQPIVASDGDLLSLDIPPEPSCPKYEVHIRNSSADAVKPIPVTAEEARNPIQFLLRSLPAGRYVLAIEGVREDGNHTEIDVHQLTVR